jgi:YVTN family beta-propeller protein
MSRFRSALPWVVAGLLLAFAATAFAGAGGGTASSGPNELVMVTNWGEDTVGLINVDTGQVLSTIPVGQKPYDVKVEPRGRFAYVTCSGGSEISVIDIQANLESCRIQVGTSPRDISLTADGTKAVVANSGDDTISVVDLVGRRQLYTVHVGAVPYGVAHLPGEQGVLITNWAEGSLSVVDLFADHGTVTHTLPVASLPYTVVVPASSSWAFMSNFGAGVVTPYNLATFQLGAPIPVGKSPWGVAATAEGDAVVIANFFENKISILNVAEKRVQSEVPLGTRPTGSPSVPGGGVTMRRAKNVATSARFIVASDLAANEILVIDRATLALLRSIPVGKAPYGLAFVETTATAAGPKNLKEAAPARGSL